MLFYFLATTTLSTTTETTTPTTTATTTETTTPTTTATTTETTTMTTTPTTTATTTETTTPTTTMTTTETTTPTTTITTTPTTTATTTPTTTATTTETTTMTTTPTTTVTTTETTTETTTPTTTITTTPTTTTVYCYKVINQLNNILTSEQIDGVEVSPEDGPGYPLQFTPTDNPYGEKIYLCAVFTERVHLTEVAITLDDSDEVLTWSFEVEIVNPNTGVKETITVAEVSILENINMVVLLNKVKTQNVHL